MKRSSVLLALLGCLLLVGVALAMSSANYRLDWFTPLTGSGGSAGSPSYGANFTVGQTVIGRAASSNYGACLGYWCTESTGGGIVRYGIYLPVVTKNVSSGFGR